MIASSGCFILLCLKGGEGDGPPVVSHFPLRWGRGLPGEGANSWLVVPSLLGELPGGIILVSIILFSLSEVKHWRMSLQKDVYEKKYSSTRQKSH